MEKLLIFILAIFLSTACSNPMEIEIMQEQSVDHIPCVANRIEIIEHETNNADGSDNWIALCNGRTYLCRKGNGTESNAIDLDVSCNEMESQMPE